MNELLMTIFAFSSGLVVLGYVLKVERNNAKANHKYMEAAYAVK